MLWWKMLLHAQIDDRVGERAAHQKFHRQIVDPLPGLGIEALLPLDPLVHERVAQGIGQGAVAVLIAGAVGIAALKAHDVVADGAAQEFGIVALEEDVVAARRLLRWCWGLAAALAPAFGRRFGPAFSCHVLLLHIQ